MIIGDDLLQAIGVDLIYSTDIPQIAWEGIQVPMKPRGELKEAEQLMQKLMESGMPLDAVFANNDVAA